MVDTAMGNIQRVKLIDVSSVDFTDENGFFIRSGSGNIKYCPINNKTDAEAITKTVEEQIYFCDPEICRKIFASGTTATAIYVGYGV
jgi:hypothetical protein